MDSQQDDSVAEIECRVPQHDECYVLVLIDRGIPAKASRPECFGSADGRNATRHTSVLDPSLHARIEPLSITHSSGDTIRYAAARWATAVVRILDSPEDPNTVSAWSSCVNASSGALRNWCSTVGIGARRSLVFGRMLRAVVLAMDRGTRAENLLNVTDKRTLKKLFELSGLPDPRLPPGVDDFLDRQTLVRDPDALAEIRRLLAVKGLRTAR
jgi:hypothetical protein